MKIAIIGSGISGLVAAHKLHPRHEITLFEASDYVGGHTHTVDVAIEGERHAIDTGFIVFNDRTYPHFCALLKELGVASQPTEMSFSVRDDSANLEYNGHSLSTLFAQRRNLLRPRFLRMLRDILRFNREARELALESDEVSVEEFLARGGYSRAFADHYLLPMGAAIWSCPTGTFAQFPIRFIAQFYANHGLLDLKNRPTWRFVSGGSRSYVEALTRPFADRIRLRTPIARVARLPDHVVVASLSGAEAFDHVIFACHSDQALKILGPDATPVEREVLSAFPYERSEAVLHTDRSQLPRRKRAWAAWNYRQSSDRSAPPYVTYYMNRLQRIESRHTFCVTLNPTTPIDDAHVLGSYVYHHPVFDSRRADAQARHAELLVAKRTSFCGAYWGNGFHEDGVASALAAVKAIETRNQLIDYAFSVARSARPRQVEVE